jgi:hypothetical protein
MLLLCTLIPAEASACACGCSVFDVGSTSLLPKEGDHGGVVYFEWDHSRQNQDWFHGNAAPSSWNGDKLIQTDWYVVGMNYMINRDWGVGVRIPFVNRSFLTDNNGPSAGPGGAGYPGSDLERYHVSTIGDVELTGMYTGFANDMSKGIMFGVKLPTGDWKAYGFDRDTNAGTGSTDLILGGFWRGMITGDNAWQYFAQTKLLQPLFVQSQNPAIFGAAGGEYIPGTEIDSAFGIIYNNWYNVGPLDKVAPVLQIIYAHKNRDSGPAASPQDSGFDRVFISPGVDLTKVIDDPNNNTMKLYADIEIPVWQYMNGGLGGGQLVQPFLSKIVLSYTF